MTCLTSESECFMFYIHHSSILCFIEIINTPPTPTLFTTLPSQLQCPISKGLSAHANQGVYLWCHGFNNNNVNILCSTSTTVICAHSTVQINKCNISKHISMSLKLAQNNKFEMINSLCLCTYINTHIYLKFILKHST